MPVIWQLFETIIHLFHPFTHIKCLLCERCCNSRGWLGGRRRVSVSKWSLWGWHTRERAHRSSTLWLESGTQKSALRRRESSLSVWNDGGCADGITLISSLIYYQSFWRVSLMFWLSLYLLHFSGVAQRVFLLFTYPFIKMNACMSQTIHHCPSPRPPYCSNKPLYWFPCFHPCQLQCIFYPQQEEWPCTSICHSPALPFQRFNLKATCFSNVLPHL